jgi:hypothetical protein
MPPLRGQQLAAAICLLVGLLVTSDLSYAQWLPDGAPVIVAPGDQINPRIASDGNGGVIVAWLDLSTGESDIFAQHISALGHPTWNAAGIPVCTVPTDQVLTEMISDGSGGAIIFWQDARDGFSAPYLQRINGDGVAQWPLNGIAAFNPAFSSAGKVAPNGANGVIIVGSGRAQHIDSLGARLWGDSGSLLNMVGDPSAACTDNHNGAVFLAPPFVHRIDSTGASEWSVDGLFGIVATVACDSAGGALTAFSRDTGSSFDIFAQRFASNGEVEWGNGAAICVMPANQFDPIVVSAGDSDYLIVWSDNRSGLSTDVYAQRVGPNGIKWTNNGVPVVVAPGDQRDLVVKADGHGGAVVVGRQTGSGSDLFAQHIGGSGDRLWNAEGIAFATLPEEQVDPSIANEDDVWFVAWADGRAKKGTYDIYVQRLHDAVTAVKNSRPPSDRVVLSTFPNPTSNSITLNFDLPHDAQATVYVCDVTGRMMRRIWSAPRATGGPKSIVFDGQDSSGKPLANGVYFFRLVYDRSVVASKFVVTR